MSNNDAKPNTCIDIHRQGRTDYIGLYRIWPAYGGGYIVTANIDGKITRDQYDAEHDARRSYNWWVDALAAQADARDAAETTAGLLAC